MSRFARAAIGLLVLGLALLVYATQVETRWIAVTHHAIQAPADSGLTAPLRIAHITDLHTQGLGSVERRLMRLARSADADLIVVTGDTATPKGTAAGYRAVWEALVELGADDVVAVTGNWEYHLGTDGALFGEAVAQTAADAGVLLLVNANARLRDDLWVLGLDDPYGGAPDRAATRAGVGEGYRLGLMHSPEPAADFAQDVDLVLAGHTHGGQVVIPFFGPPLLPPGSGDFVAGWYERAGTPIYISRGIGNSIAPIRFNCRPELAIIDVAPAP